VKKVKNAFGCTVNDVVMAVCAGALRRYLLARPDADPEALSEALVAMIPMSVRTDDQKGEHGNQVSAMLASLATNEPDAVARLRKISEGMHKAKGQQETIGARTLQEWTEFASPAVAGRAARAYSRFRIADRHRPLFNLTISNVPGPPYPLYLAGARLLAHYPLGPINDGAGLNITVMSYMTDLDVGIVSCSDLIEDPEVILEGMAAQLAEYLHS
jgi:diacylglycerol O-acyltransferase